MDEYVRSARRLNGECESALFKGLRSKRNMPSKIFQKPHSVLRRGQQQPFLLTHRRCFEREKPVKKPFSPLRRSAQTAKPQLFHRLNACKLTRDFKRLFGKTVYEYVREQRFETAYPLFDSGACNVSEAAFAAGYATVSHFSEGFQKTFGVPPQAVKKNRRVLTAADRF